MKGASHCLKLNHSFTFKLRCGPESDVLAITAALKRTALTTLRRAAGRRQPGPTPGQAPADLGLEGRASPNAAPAAANITPEGATGPAADAAAPSPPAPGPLAVLDDRDTADNSEGGVLLGRPDFGAIFRAVPPPPAAGVGVGAAAGEALRPGDGTTVFACGPVGMIREVQVGL